MALIDWSAEPMNSDFPLWSRLGFDEEYIIANTSPFVIETDADEVSVELVLALGIDSSEGDVRSLDTHLPICLLPGDLLQVNLAPFAKMVAAYVFFKEGGRGREERIVFLPRVLTDKYYQLQIKNKRGPSLDSSQSSKNNQYSW